MRCNLGPPRWIKPTKAEVAACALPKGKRARFDLIAGHTKGDSGLNDVCKVIQEGDLVAFRMTDKEKRDELLHGNIKAVSYLMMQYAHLSIAVKDPDNPRALRLYTSQGARGPNILDTLDELAHHSFDVYRLDRWKQLDMVRLREFVHRSINKKNKIFSYNFVGMVGIWSNCLEPHTPSEIGDDYLCSTAVAAALHYSGLDLDAVRCCEALNMVSPLRVVSSTGRIMPRREMLAPNHRESCQTGQD
ncbi:MAG: hypothetical protein H7A51_14040 [Akkermansiaceae bacterium]|nr:hypothetical protein [Akkermansiaceae bacterium]